MIRVQPDIAFIEHLRDETGSALNTCMQCGACTAVCELSSDQNVFPRKQMILAAWGMKDQLMSDPNIWKCHQCGDCTESCPREVKPGEILVALRKQQYLFYARPAAIARMIRKPAFLPAVIGFPVLIIVFILLMAGTLAIPEGTVNYSEFFPHAWLNASFSILFFLSTAGIVISMRKFWKNMKAEMKGDSDPSAALSFLQVVLNIFAHRDFNRCGEQKHRSLAHFLVFWGFGLLLFVTFFAILSTILFEYPLSFFNPIKIAGNTGAIMLLIGTSLLIIRRLLKADSIKSDYSDWLFLISFWLLTVSGILVEAARFLDWQSAYHLYFFHLVMVWIIILYYPYTKFAHFLYRTTALISMRK